MDFFGYNFNISFCQISYLSFYLNKISLGNFVNFVRTPDICFLVFAHIHQNFGRHTWSHSDFMIVVEPWLSKCPKVLHLWFILPAKLICNILFVSLMSDIRMDLWWHCESLCFLNLSNAVFQKHRWKTSAKEPNPQ